MAQAAAPANDRKRVKVYELKNNDWFDRGTGFCTGRLVNVSIVLCCVVLCCVALCWRRQRATRDDDIIHSPYCIFNTDTPFPDRMKREYVSIPRKIPNGNF